jgi:hypothetical protein
MEPVADDDITGNGNRQEDGPSSDRPVVDKAAIGSPRHQARGRPPHAPYSKQHGYPGQYAGYGSTRPPQQLQSVVTSSFSAEDERDPSHRGSYPPVPRHVNVSINPADQHNWGGPPDDRFPPERLDVEVRQTDLERRQEPPAEDRSTSPSVVPPSPARDRGLPPLSRTSSSGVPYMSSSEPLKRSFWHHSRPNEEFSTSLPAEFIPPKRTKISTNNARSDPPSRSPMGLDTRDLRRPYSFFNGSLSWDSRGDEMPYYHNMPSARESPRYGAEIGRSFHHHTMGGPPPPHHHYHHHHRRSSPSPPSSYRDDEMGSMSDHSRSRGLPPPLRGHHLSYPPPPPHEVSYHHHHSSPSHAAAAGGAAAHHGRRWSHPDSWQPPLPSPTSAHRRSPTNYHHPHSGSPIMQFRDDIESHRGWSQSRDRDPMPSLHDDPRRLPHFDSIDHDGGYHHNAHSSYHPSPYYGRSTRPMHHKPLELHHSNIPNGRGDVSIDPPSQRSDGSPTNGSKNSDGADIKAVSPDKDGPRLFLALPQDRIALSETLCVVREVSYLNVCRFESRLTCTRTEVSPLPSLKNIEVFTATKSDVEAPAPGRKHTVVVGQVGLRCIHCRHTTRSSDRVKRAVCYPSSIKRIYRTVIDMKLDHFLHCKFVPTALKERLAELKVKHTRSTGTTMQYFISAAHQLGFEDGASGVRLSTKVVPRPTDGSEPEVKAGATEPPSDYTASSKQKSEDFRVPDPQTTSSSDQLPIPRMDSLTSETSALTPEDVGTIPGTLFTGKINLALPEDKMALSPLRCFLRSQVCAFSATAEDIAVRAPTTFSIAIGQVGIGCIHCVNQPSKLRSNRAVCFPFSISRIYQSVADIQRFHFGECKMLPAEVKDIFLDLQRASSKGSKGLATRQYWITSAKKIGLVDTPRGIRFGRDPTMPETTSMSLDILAQVAFNVTTASRRLVLPEDKPFIAEFLYVVMEQLQPCRFTDADRNKRRLKDVGCIGVECKHCAGQVDGRKFFWSSVNAVESNFVSVHTHMMECSMIPPELKDQLRELKKLRKEQTAALKSGSQKSFFSRVWGRLHGDVEKDDGDSNNSTTSASPVNSPALSSGCPSPMMSETDSVAVAGVSDEMRQMSVVEI